MTETPTTDKEILESANLEQENEIDEDGGIEIFHGIVVKPNSLEARNALEIL